MRIIGLMVARSEAWILPASIPAALQWLDGLVILDHASGDNTNQVICSFESDIIAGKIVTSRIDSPNWDESTYRKVALSHGREMGGTHFCVLDSDEMLTPTFYDLLKSEAAAMQPGDLLRLPWLQCWRSLDQYRSDASTFGHAGVNFLFCDSPELKYELPRDGYQLHARVPSGLHPREFGDRDLGGVLHFQHANWRRVLWKQMLYQMDELIRWPNRRPAAVVSEQYKPTTNEDGIQFSPIPDSWWPVSKDLIDMNAEPWQKAEVIRLLHVHGWKKFAGLDFTNTLHHPPKPK